MPAGGEARALSRGGLGRMGEHLSLHRGSVFDRDAQPLAKVVQEDTFVTRESSIAPR